MRRILIAEPNPDVRSLLDVLVRKLGFEHVKPVSCAAVGTALRSAFAA